MEITSIPLLNHELILKYWGDLPELHRAHALLSAMCQPIKKGEKYLDLGTKEIKISQEDWQLEFHPFHLRLHSRFQTKNTIVKEGTCGCRTCDYHSEDTKVEQTKDEQEPTYDRRLQEIISDPSFRIYGLTLEDIRQLQTYWKTNRIDWPPSKKSDEVEEKIEWISRWSVPPYEALKKELRELVQVAKKEVPHGTTRT